MEAVFQVEAKPFLKILLLSILPTRNATSTLPPAVCTRLRVPSRRKAARANVSAPLIVAPPHPPQPNAQPPACDARSSEPL